MSTTITLWNVVGKTENAFLVTIVPLHRHFNGNAIFTLLHKVEYVFVYWRFITVQVINECADTAFVFKEFILIVTLVD